MFIKISPTLSAPSCFPLQLLFALFLQRQHYLIRIVFQSSDRADLRSEDGAIDTPIDTLIVKRRSLALLRHKMHQHGFFVTFPTADLQNNVQLFLFFK